MLIEEEALRQGPIEVGEAVLTPGGNLPATHVIHVAVMGPDLKTDPETIAAATRSVLAGGRTSLPPSPCPPWARGSAGGLPAQSAEAMVSTLSRT